MEYSALHSPKSELSDESAETKSESRFSGVWRIVLWLALFKTAYLACVIAAGSLWPNHFDEAKRQATNEKWFQSANRSSTPIKVTALSRHFATWDAAHYLLLGEAGYSPGLKSAAFYPLWPLLIRCASFLSGGDGVWASVLLANALSISGWTVFYLMVKRRFSPLIARRALFCLVIFPGSLFYQFIYSESLFFLLLMLLWFGLDVRVDQIAWTAAFLLPLSRAVGAFVVLPIAWCCIASGSMERSNWLRCTRLTIAAPLGLACYFVLMWLWTGNPFEGMQAQKYWGAHSVSNLWNVPKFVIGCFNPTSWHGFRGSLLDRCFFLLLLLFLPLIWRLGKDLAVWSFVLAILPAMSGTFVSFTRFESTCFPLFIAQAVWFSRLRNRRLFTVFVAVCCILHGVLLWRFVNYRWAG